MKYQVKTIQDPTDEIIAEYLSDGWEIIWQVIHPEIYELVRFKRVIPLTPEQQQAEMFARWDAEQKQYFTQVTGNPDLDDPIIKPEWIKEIQTINPQATLWIDDDMLQIRVNDVVVCTHGNLGSCLHSLHEWTNKPDLGGAE